MNAAQGVCSLIERGLAAIASPVYSHTVNGNPICNARVVRTAFAVMSLALGLIFGAVCAAMTVARGTMHRWSLCGAVVCGAVALVLGLIDHLRRPQEGFGPGSVRYIFPRNVMGNQEDVEVIVSRELTGALPEGVVRQRL